MAQSHTDSARVSGADTDLGWIGSITQTKHLILVSRDRRQALREGQGRAGVAVDPLKCLRSYERTASHQGFIYRTNSVNF